jgi:branched-chain amino acid transport system substrate-binding protein
LPAEFVKPFEAAYGHAPAPESIFGYEAMSAILSVLTHASSSADDRVDVVKDFFAIKDRASVLGTYSIDTDGDTSIAPFVINRFQKGAFVPVKFVQASP